MRQIIPEKDEQFGRAFFQGIAEERTKNGHIRWDMLCLCGNPFTANADNLRSGNTESCGCLHQEIRTTHGLHHSPVYQVYHDMLQRCRNPKHKQYKNYGARGITCDWQTFEDFYCDMGPSYQPGLTIERKDVNGPYSKENCRWATHKEQQNNRRDNVRITFNGETWTRAGWEQHLGMKEGTLRGRFRLGWSEERALTEPVRRIRKE